MSVVHSEPPFSTPREASELADRNPAAVALPVKPLNYEGRPVVLATSRYVLLPLASLITGYTVKAMQRKIERNVWRERREYRRAPDGHILLDVLGYESWVDNGRRCRR